MLNNKVLLIAVAVLVLGGGLMFYLFNGGQTTGVSSPLSKRGELTRELAKKLIMDSYATADASSETTVADYNSYYGGYEISMWLFQDKEGKIDQLVSKGLVTKQGKKFHHVDYDISAIAFTDAATPYLPQSTGMTDSRKIIELSTYTVKDIEVTGITSEGEAKAKAEISIKGEYLFTPFGEVLSSYLNDPKPRRDGVIVSFTLFDDGWRLQ